MKFVSFLKKKKFQQELPEKTIYSTKVNINVFQSFLFKIILNEHGTFSDIQF